MSADHIHAQRRSERQSAARDPRSLEAEMAGTVLGPGDPDWDAARRA
jgi:hypothetical protein